MSLRQNFIASFQRFAGLIGGNRDNNTMEPLLYQESAPVISTVYSKTLRKSWSLTIHNNSRILRLPTALQDAPPEIRDCLDAWAALNRPHLKKHRAEYYARKKQLERKVWTYLSEKGTTSHRRIVNPEKFREKTEGRVYNLNLIFNALNQHFFNNDVKSFIRWGRPGSRTSFQSMYLDGNGSLFSLITIADIYDHPLIPRFAIESIVYHEMLHVAVPPYKKNGRTIMHGPEFKNAERSFPEFERWRTWERTTLPKIIRKIISDNSQLQ